MKIHKGQIKAIGNGVYAERMRVYLNEQFPESKDIDDKELEAIILSLTDKAAGYKLILETHVAPFIVASWVMGLEFDQDFLAAKEVLEDLDMDSGEKAEWIWQFLIQTIGILEDDDDDPDGVGGEADIAYFNQFL